MSEPIVAEKVVLYTDGGFLPDKKISGYGVHGYTFTDDAPKKGTGNPKAMPTDNGYIGVDIVGNKVTVVDYIDIVGGSQSLNTSNEAELSALYQALVWLCSHDVIKKALILSDSMLCVKGLAFLPEWTERNGITAKGTPVKYWTLWKEVWKVYEPLLKGIDIEVRHIPRDASIGNVIADSLATRGIVMGSNGNPELMTTLQPAQGYWGIKNVVPRILQAPRWYFSTTDFDFKRPDGSTIYYTGTHGTKDKEDELYGKRYSDNVLGVVRVKEADPVMEALRRSAISKDPKQYGAIVIGHLDAIFSPRTYKDLSENGTTFLFDNPKRIDLIDSKKVEILVEMTPPGLGFRGAGQWASMTKVLDGVIAGDPDYIVTDLTDILYEDREEKKKTTRKLKPEITQITKFLDVKVTFNLEKRQDEPKPHEGKVRLILGSDILSRNQLAALAEDVKAVRVVTWRDSEVVGRYATLVELNSGDIGIWVRTEANLYYAVKPKLN